VAKKEVILGSFDPDEMSSGGGLASNFTGEIIDAQYGLFKYRGKGDAVVAVKLTIKPDEGHGIADDMLVDGNVEEWYKVADPTQWAPTQDGETAIDFDQDEEGTGPLLMAIGDQKQLNRNTKFGEFISKAIEAGMPRALAGNDLRKLLGVYGHFDRMVSEAAKRAQERDKGKDQKKYPTEILLLTKFETMKSKGKATSKSSTASAPASSNGGGELNDRVASAIVAALGEHGDIKKAELGSKIIGGFKGAEMKAALKLASDPEFLGDEDQPWSFDAKKGVVSPL